MNIKVKKTLNFTKKIDWEEVKKQGYADLMVNYIEITDMIHSADAETEKAIHVCTQAGCARNTTYYKWIAKSQIVCLSVSFPGMFRDGGASLVPQEDECHYYAPRWMFR